MAKKQKERSEAEYLRSIVRNLKSENRNLRKQLGRNNKRAHQYEDLEEQIQELALIETPVEVNKKCPKCKGKLKTSDLGIKLFIKCEDCNYRETKKKT